MTQSIIEREKYKNPLIKTVDNPLTNLHSFLIGFLTLSLMIFILNPELLLNSIAITTSFLLNI